MKPREFDPRRLDVKAFAKAAGELSGCWPVSSFERLGDVLALGDGASGPDGVRWSARGEELPVRGGTSQVWLHVQADAAMMMVCQRCLSTYQHAMAVRVHVQFVADEEAAAELDADVEHEVLAFCKELDLHELLEDELLLDLPLVPRHELCPQPLALTDDDELEAPRQHPFAALAGLRSGKR